MTPLPSKLLLVETPDVYNFLPTILMPLRRLLSHDDLEDILDSSTLKMRARSGKLKSYVAAYTLAICMHTICSVKGSTPLLYSDFIGFTLI